MLIYWIDLGYIEHLGANLNILKKNLGHFEHLDFFESKYWKLWLICIALIWRIILFKDFFRCNLYREDAKKTLINKK